MADRIVVAVDLGNESGRLFLCRFDGSRLSDTEQTRFATLPVLLNGTLHWDVLRIWDQISTGLNTLLTQSTDGIIDGVIDGIGVCSFGVDYGLLDARGHLISNPVHMRDARTQGTLAQVESLIPALDLYHRTGIVPHVINTLYQLVAARRATSWQLDAAHSLLTMPNLINYWLTGQVFSEYTHATTTQLVSVHSRTWDSELLKLLGLKSTLFPPIIQPGIQTGTYRDTAVFSVASHDTASAVLAIPADGTNFAYISSGTWSLIGVETDAPLLSAEALRAGITNEGGAFGTYRPLCLVMGLWLLQGCRTAFAAQGQDFSYARLVAMIQDVPLHQHFIDPDHSSFFAPLDMVQAVRTYCLQSGQSAPDSVGSVVRCVLESLALKYRRVITNIARIAHKQIDVVHIVGGGSQNVALCQMTADVLNLPVVAGPVEAAALGNGVMQLSALGEIGGLDQVRQIMRDSCARTRYMPDADTQSAWMDTIARFDHLIHA